MKKNLILIIILIFNLNSIYGQNLYENDCTKTTERIEIDLQKIVILNSEKEIFGEDAKKAAINNDELILIECIFENALGTKKSFNKYYKQIVPVINKNGEKEVWINCFCAYSDVIRDFDWKKEIFYIEDGGSCYLNLKINLSKKEFYDLFVNGNA